MKYRVWARFGEYDVWSPVSVPFATDQAAAKWAQSLNITDWRIEEEDE